MALEMPESEESTGNTAEAVVEVAADEGHRSDVTDSSHIIEVVANLQINHTFFRDTNVSSSHLILKEKLLITLLTAS